MLATLLISLTLLAPPATAAPPSAESATVTEPAPPTTIADRPPPSTYDRLKLGGGEPIDEQEISWGAQLLKTLVGLGVVVGLIYLLFRLGLARYLGGAALRGAGRGLKVVERTQLDARHALLIVEVEGRRLLLATGEHGVQQLAELGPTAAPSAPASTFAQTLTKTASPRPPPAADSPGEFDGPPNR